MDPHFFADPDPESQIVADLTDLDPKALASHCQNS